MERSSDSLAGMATSAFGAGTYTAMRHATSTRGILEFLINLFTCGGVHRRNEKHYQELIEAMAETLKNSMSDRRNAPLPENIILDNVDGARIEFSLPGANNETGQVIVCVSKGGNSESKEIPQDAFEKVCRALLFRCEFSLSQTPIILTAQGGMYLKDAVLTGANLSMEDLSYADLYGAKLDEAVLFMADCKGANFKGATLSGASLGNSNLTDACLENAIMYSANLDNANLTGANLQGASLLGCSMMGCNLCGANMEHANASGAILTGANMTDAILKNTIMMAARMDGAILTRANLQKANLMSASLEGADLYQADLKNTHLKDCTLTSSCTEEAKMSTSTQTLFHEFYSDDV
ncbi:type III secretion system effector PipB2 [Salmonella enterica]|uniref:Type III secretion system effector PipB2 n=1 Tax=Salmonella enterica subsp. VII serovar 40:z4,z24:[z39] TaxID=1967625 RepID=A0A731TTN4_SALEE|nr:type III secretion system effector PipB2 [Salmonella enterica]EDO5295053.1 type III secretion system effector PipB2 [Salmonella enterica subsp. houtenae serovar 40:z4,z24:-]QUZ24520.1 type III secretion system effector PipB2 [Salmonella enterica subsp. VII str. CFSAN000554]HAE4733985.1 type III secretion system effector PipB2 [Salmonella enterica subsp. VII serovar 40:z4,z24:[z39]]HCA3675424.1 type III secretion system effector PipB2 [Salmonella enterica subsp. houtenae serovar Houten]